MFVSIIETVIFPVAVGFLLNYLLGKKKAFAEAQKVMPGIAVLGLAFVVGGVVSSQGSKFFTSGVVILRQFCYITDLDICSDTVQESW